MDCIVSGASPECHQTFLHNVRAPLPGRSSWSQQLWWQPAVQRETMLLALGVQLGSSIPFNGSHCMLAVGILPRQSEEVQRLPHGGLLQPAVPSAALEAGRAQALLSRRSWRQAAVPPAAAAAGCDELWRAAALQCAAGWGEEKTGSREWHGNIDSTTEGSMWRNMESGWI